MNSYSISILMVLILTKGLRLISGSRELPWPIYCQTISGEFCRVKVDQRKLLCPSSCNGDRHKDETSQLIVDLALETKSLEHSRIKRDISAYDVFLTTLIVELTRLFIDNSFRYTYKIIIEL